VGISLDEDFDVMAFFRELNSMNDSLGKGGEGKSFTFDNGPVELKYEPSGGGGTKFKPVFTDLDPHFIFVIDDQE
jgi:hypothetical protein